MCEICKQSPCPSGCPNADEPKSAKLCAWCDGELFVGDDIYKVNGEDICTDCIESCKTTIEEEDPSDE